MAILKYLTEQDNDLVSVNDSLGELTDIGNIYLEPVIRHKG